MTGFNARVIRVWFQNRRCKEHKRVKAAVLITRKVSRLSLTHHTHTHTHTALFPYLPLLKFFSVDDNFVLILIPYTYSSSKSPDEWLLLKGLPANRTAQGFDKLGVVGGRDSTYKGDGLSGMRRENW